MTVPYASIACSCLCVSACVINGSQYWAVDRDTFPHSEERLDMALLPPKSLDEWRAALMGWNGFALSMHSAAPIDPTTGRPASGELPAAKRDLRIEAGLQMLGDPKNAIDRKLTVRHLCSAGVTTNSHDQLVAGVGNVLRCLPEAW